MKTLTLVAGTLALLLGAANSKADVALDNLTEPGVRTQDTFAGSGFARVFSTGEGVFSVTNVTLEEIVTKPPPAMEVRIYRIVGGVPTELVGVLDNPKADDTPADPPLPRLVSYSSSATIELEPYSTYALAAWQTDGETVSPVFTLEAGTILSDWQLGDDLFLWELDAENLLWWLDGGGHLKCMLEGTLIKNHAPDTTGAFATVPVLWPPNGKMIPFQVTGATDQDGDKVTIAITKIEQDEEVKKEGYDNTSPDASFTPGTNSGLLRAERFGDSNGRVYTIYFTASDGKENGTVQDFVQVVVPHDKGTQVLDEGPVAGYFDSTAQ